MTGSDRTVRNTSRNTNTVSSGRMAQTCQLLGLGRSSFPVPAGLRRRRRRAAEEPTQVGHGTMITDLLMLN